MNLEPGPHAVDIDGVTQAYEASGQGPVTVVHSGGPGIDSGYPRMPLLEQHMTMVYWTRSGTGRSDFLPGGDYSIAYARFARELIARLGATRPCFIGHSHGGFVGLELAAENPGLLGGLIAYSTAAQAGPELRAEGGRQMAAFVRRYPNEPKAVRAGQVWRSLRASRRRARRSMPDSSRASCPRTSPTTGRWSRSSARSP
ncbi:alpha/beta fold hydrolase [Kutzneria sp. 744]|uniref:alpha/beta fold hydrolase n=1 Tax=Kutzneria sp. (strain 744) TaxID=345341 RepID=UPI0003EED792|nr:alpha/beta hydrolase [Kutzneria sp. 744]EWM17174.1 hydrolase [Kutzneria sp. 744]